jgi:hypothetical protein
MTDKEFMDGVYKTIHGHTFDEYKKEWGQDIDEDEDVHKRTLRFLKHLDELWEEWTDAGFNKDDTVLSKDKLRNVMEYLSALSESHNKLQDTLKS